MRPIRAPAPASALKAIGTILWIVGIGATVVARPLHGQKAPSLVSVEVDLDAYGIENLDDVTRGRVSLAHDPKGMRLSIYSLHTTPLLPRPTPPEPPPEPRPTTRDGARPPHTALWVWSTRELLDDFSERQVFLDFVEQQAITRVFLYTPPAAGSHALAGYIPFSSEEIGPLISELRGRGALTYALDGDPAYVLPKNHAGVFRTVERLVEHNRRVPVEQRFHGVRYNVEPYLLGSGFQGIHRQALLDGYVALLAGISRIGRAGGMVTGVDVPFWFDTPDEETGAYLEAVLDGERKGLLPHIADLMDDIAIMDYRTRVDGPNGVLAHAYHELELGEVTGVGIFVGLETISLVEEDLYSFRGPGTRGLPQPGESTRWIVLESSTEHSRMWLVVGEDGRKEVAERIDPDASVRHWPTGRAIRIAEDLRSFHNLGRERFIEASDRIVRHLVDQSAFLGLAFHDYQGLRDLLSRR